MKTLRCIFTIFYRLQKVLKQARKYELFERRLANPIAIVCEDPAIRYICNQISFLILGPDLYQMPDKVNERRVVSQPLD